MSNTNDKLKATRPMDDMLEAAKPLMKWLNENYHPHHHVIVDHTSVELAESVMLNIDYSFVVD